MLTNVRDPGNAGTVIRGADAAGADAVIVSDASVDVYNSKVVRSTVGSLWHLPISVGATVPEIFAALRGTGLRLLAADGAGTTLLHELDLGRAARQRLGHGQRGVGPAAGDPRRVRRGRARAHLRARRVAQPRDGGHGLPLRLGRGAPRRRLTAPVGASPVTILPSMTTADGERSAGHARLRRAPVASMAELLPDGLVVVGADRRVRLVNAEALRILDIPDRADLIGLPVDDVLPLTDKYGRDWWAHADPWDGAASRTGHLEKLLVGPRGKEVLVTARYVRSAADGDARVERVMLGLRDAEARQRAERDQATVLSTVAHELRAPLTSVTGFTSSLLRRWDRFTDEQKRLMIETIEADATRLTRLITELLDISRLDSDSLNLRLGPGRPARPAHAPTSCATSSAAPPAPCGSSSVTSAEEQGLPEMWADADRLEQIFFNLIENAPAPRRRHRHGDPRPSVGDVGRRASRSTTRATASRRPTARRSSAASGTAPPTRAPGSGSTSCAASSRRTAARSPWATTTPAAPASTCACRPGLPDVVAQ